MIVRKNRVILLISDFKFLIDKQFSPFINASYKRKHDNLHIKQSSLL